MRPGAAAKREWLETNGIGGFASSTITGLNARRYHGLLVAATKPPVGRVVLLAKLEETLVIKGRRFDLSANRYTGAIHPQGYKQLKEFRLDPFPVFTYAVEGIEIEKSVFMIYGENSTVIHYKVRGVGNDCFLEVRPLIAFRDYHSTTHENSSLNPRVESEPGLANVTPYAGLPTLYLAHDAQEIDTTGYWYRNFELEVERERGLDFKEDLFAPLSLKFDLNVCREAAIIASTEALQVCDAARYRQNEIERRAGVVDSAPNEDKLVRALATRSFRVRRFVAKPQNKRAQILIRFLE